ncbi:hypothetical protein G3M48_005407 [Beauveria asiatica]|uniref:Uncharacterized protein n=1 Tax=Beauveria asiatica TaxID=1069075 RepID=A0AAW0RRM7_9HYPO
MDTSSYSTNANAYPSFPTPQDRLGSQGPPFRQKQPRESCGQSYMTNFGQNLANCHMPAGFPTQQPQIMDHGQKFAAGYTPGPALLTVASLGDLQSLEKKIEQRLDSNLHQVSNSLSQATEHCRSLERFVNCSLHDIVAKTRTAMKLGLDSNQRTLKDYLDAQKFNFEASCEQRVQFIEQQLTSLKDGYHTLLRTMEQVSGRVAATQESMQKMEHKTDTMSEAIIKALKELQVSMVTKDDLRSMGDIVLERQQTLREDVAKFSVDTLQSLSTLRESAEAMHGLVQDNTDRNEACCQSVHGLRPCVVTKDGVIQHADETFEKQQMIHDTRDKSTAGFRDDVLQSLATLKESVATMQSLAQNNARSSEAMLQTLQKLEGCMNSKELIPEVLKIFHESVLAMQVLTQNSASTNEACIQRLESIVAGVERGSGYTNEILKDSMSEVKNALDNVASLVRTFSSQVNIVVGPNMTTRAAAARKRQRNSR